MAPMQTARPRTAGVGAVVTAALAGLIAVLAIATQQSALIAILGAAAMVLALLVAAASAWRHPAAPPSPASAGPAVSARPDPADAEPSAVSSAAPALTTVGRLSRIGTWTYDYGTGDVTWSDEVAEIHGQPAGHRPTSDETIEYFAAGDRDRLRDAITRSAENGEPFMEECLIDAADGARRTILIIGEPLRDEQDRPQLLRGTIQDLTPWREAASSAEAQRRRFTELTRALPLAVWSATADGVVDYVSEALADYAGGDVQEFVADGWLALVHPHDKEMMVERWSAAIQNAQPYEVECRVRSRDGEYRWHRVSAKPEVGNDGTVARWWGSSIDIHRTRALKQQAQQLARERDVILDSMSDGVLGLDAHWNITYMNDHAQEMLGQARESLLGHDLRVEYPNILNTPVHDAYRAAIVTRERQFLSFHDRTQDRWLEITATPSELGITVFLRDVTQTRLLSEQLEQAQRLEAVGRLTGGIAHDFNNLLTVVIGGADAVARDGGISPASREMIGLVRQAADRGGQLTSRLLAFARRQPLAPQHTDLNHLLEEFSPLLHRTLGDGITITTVMEPGLPPALVDPGQFENAVLNLAINARDAMPDGGSLTLETSLQHLDERYTTAHAEVDPGTYVTVTVTDSGTGIAPEALDHLFEPFYTTKEVGQGSGMGLAMAWGFARQSGGHITVYSEVGIGSAFRLYLPLAPAGSAAAAPVRATGTAPEHGSGVILLAEDDPLVRSFATDHLRALGYDVVPASTGPEALARLEQMETVDLLFTDVIMPEGMTGRDLAGQVVAARPGTPVLYASGYTENVIMHDGRLDEGVALLTKPYSAHELALRVHEQMTGAAGEE